MKIKNDENGNEIKEHQMKDTQEDDKQESNDTKSDDTDLKTLTSQEPDQNKAISLESKVLEEKEDRNKKIVSEETDTSTVSIEDAAKPSEDTEDDAQKPSTSINEKQNDELEKDGKKDEESDMEHVAKKPKIEEEKPIVLSPAAKQQIIEKYKFGDATKDRFLKAFFDVLYPRLTGCSDVDKIARISCELVTEISEMDKLKDNAFIRSKIWNLQDKNNVHAKNLYDGKTSAIEYLKLTNEEMKSENLKVKEEKIMEDSLKDSQFAKAQAETDIFKCGRCKNRKTTYYQLQTRSADEPMTTFVTCTVCNKRWKF